jgi:hypothetical protein
MLFLQTKKLKVILTTKRDYFKPAERSEKYGSLFALVSKAFTEGLLVQRTTQPYSPPPFRHFAHIVCRDQVPHKKYQLGCFLLQHFPFVIICYFADHS